MLTVGILLTGCGSSIPRYQEPPQPTPLQTLSCPASLGTLKDDSFGSTTVKLVEVAGVYYECRKSIFGGKKDE